MWHSGHLMTRRDSKRTRTPKKRVLGQAEQGVQGAQNMLRQLIAKADPESVKRKG